MMLALGERYESDIKHDHKLMPWLVRCVNYLIDTCHLCATGRTAHEMTTGKPYKHGIVELGEQILCELYHRGTKLEPKWEVGVFVGIGQSTRAQEADCRPAVRPRVLDKHHQTPEDPLVKRMHITQQMIDSHKPTRGCPA
eukprot:1605800-Amphidinium_carterae.2